MHYPRGMPDPIIDSTFDPESIADLMVQAKRLAKAYRERTGRPLGVTGEVAEFEAARLLGLRLAPVRHPGFDAVHVSGDVVRRLQIKSRVILDDAKPGQRLSTISLKHPWDAALLVVLDSDLEPTTIYEAERPAVEAALLAPGSRSRNERGQLPMSKFKQIAKVVWRRTCVVGIARSDPAPSNQIPSGRSDPTHGDPGPKVAREGT